MKTNLWSAMGAVGMFASVLCGCGGGPYLFPEVYEEYGGFDDYTETQGLVQGDAGNFNGIDTVTPFATWSWGEGADKEIGYTSDVAVPGGSVLVDATIVGADRLVIGEPLHFTSEFQEIGGVWLDVYVCPNGEGESGSADDVVLTKLEDGTITVVATAQAPEQNLDLNVEVAAGMAARPTASFSEMK